MAKRNIGITGIMRKMGFTQAQDKTLTIKDSAFAEYRPGTVYVCHEVSVSLDLLMTMQLDLNPDRPFYLMEINEEKGFAVLSLNMQA